MAVDMKVLLGRLNQFLKNSLTDGAKYCVNRTHYEVTVEHLLVRLVENPNADMQAILRYTEVDPAAVLRVLQAELEEMRRGNTGKPVFSPTLLKWFEEGWMLSAAEYESMEVRSGALIVALLENPLRYTSAKVSEVFDHVDVAAVKSDMLDIVAGSIEDKGATGTAKAAVAGGALQQYCTNFTDRAREGAIDPIFGRDREIRQMVDILARRRKNNPIVVGEAGVGKTAVVEGLALAIVKGDVPDIMKNIDLWCLDLGLLQAGASMKGEFENRLKNVIEEVKASAKPIIMFIDEAHTLIGAGGSAGGGDAANLLKPALARGELRTVAATTWSEYKKYFEKDPALARRFQLVKLDEPSEEDTAVMLRGLRTRYEEAHNVRISEEAVKAAASFSNRYITGRYLPDKAVDLIDTAAARVKIGLSSRPPALQDAERLIQTLEREINSIVKDRSEGLEIEEERIPELEAEIAAAKDVMMGIEGRWRAESDAVNLILECRRKLYGKKPEKVEGEEAEEEAPAEPIDEAAIKVELDAANAALAKLQGSDPLISVDVTPEVIGQVVSDWTGIPLGKMVSDEAGAVLNLRETLAGRIKGQDHALEAIAQGISASKAGVGNPDTPIGVFLLVGPSGVGKTETGLGLADQLFGGERFICTINMSEFQEKHTVSRLIGSPPGYVGYGEGGVLTEAVRQRPYSVVLLDECEKADPEVLNLFYQVFDKGMLSDGEGRVIDFKNTVVLLTSNLATDTITEMGQSPIKPDVDDVVSAIRPELSAHFKPALLGRMTIVPFFPIDMDAMKMIVGLKLNKLGKRLFDSHRMKFEYTDAVVESIAERCTEVETGARNIDHIMHGTLLPEISKEILSRMAEEDLPDRLCVGIDAEGNFTYEFSSVQA
jgi:type VI secretion system protein VasG